VAVLTKETAPLKESVAHSKPLIDASLSVLGALLRQINVADLK
jgi:hypothetical protein